MLRALKYDTANRQTRAQRLALLFLVIYIVILLSALIMVIMNADHECIGDDCPICKLTNIVERLLKQIGKAVLAVSVLHAAVLVMITAIINRAIYGNSSTLVNARVRLNI